MYQFEEPFLTGLGGWRTRWKHDFDVSHPQNLYKTPRSEKVMFMVSFSSNSLFESLFITMRFRSTWEFSLVTLVFSNYAFAYTWPNPQLDELESQRYDRLGHNARDLASGVDPCDLFLFNETGKDTSGRLDAADWIRTVSVETFSKIAVAELTGISARHTMTWPLMTFRMEAGVWMPPFD